MDINILSVIPFIILGDYIKEKKKLKKIWLINPYGPIEGENWRDYSFNQFGKYLSKNGYNVIWWTSNFAHHFKKYRSKGLKDIRISENYTIRLVPSISYRNNRSIKRFFRDLFFGIKIHNIIDKDALPDLIIEYANPLHLGIPTFFLKKKHKIPFIIDQMDIWPEFIINQTPIILKPLIYLFSLPIYWIRKKIYSKSDGIIALGKNYLDFALNRSKNKDKPTGLIYNGIDVNDFRNKMNNKISDKILKKLPIKNKNDIWFVFAGTFGPSYDIIPIIESSRRAANENLSIKIILAGSGPMVDLVINETKINNKIFYLGSLLPEELGPIYSLCDVGLSAYSSKSNVDMPDKFYDYTASGLAVLNSLNGEVKEFINEHNCGLNYIASNSDDLYTKIKFLSNDNKKLNDYKVNSHNLGNFFDLNNQNKVLKEVIIKIIGDKQK